MRGKRLGGFARRDRPFAERHLSRFMPCAAPTCGHMPHLRVTFHRHRERPRRLRSALSELTCRSMESSVLPAPQGRPQRVAGLEPQRVAADAVIFARIVEDRRRNQ
jgi:hypothetical protein